MDTNTENRIMAAGYIRVLNDGSSGAAEQQMDRIKRFAAAHNMEVVRFYVDDAADATSGFAC